jgi:hypothetical protein
VKVMFKKNIKMIVNLTDIFNSFKIVQKFCFLTFLKLMNHTQRT